MLGEHLALLLALKEILAYCLLDFFFLAECFKFLSVDVALEREAEGDLLLADMGQV